MNRVHSYFNDYSAYHQTRGNQVTHFVGIPFILIGLLGLCSQWVFSRAIWIQFPWLQLDGGLVLLLFGIAVYLKLDWRLGSMFSFILIGFYSLGRSLPLSGVWFLFISGWILQGVGHACYEKKAPAFLTNLTHLLIGPLWIFAKMIRYKSSRGSSLSF